MKERINNNWLFVLVILQPILDIIAYFQYDSTIGTMAGYFRLVVMLVIPVFVLVKKRKLSFVILMGIIGLYCALHILSCYITGYSSLFADVSYMLKVVQMPVLGISFCYLFDKETYREQIVKGFVVNYIIIILSMFAAHITGTGVYTYNDYKIGYMGWFANANSQSIILISMAPFLVYFAIKKKSKIGILLSMIGVTLVLLANGTKAGYLAVFGIFLGFIAFYIIDLFLSEKGKRKIQPAMILVSFLIVITAALAYPITPRYAMDTYSNGKREEENQTLEKKKSVIAAGKNGEVETLEEILADPEKKKALIDCYKEDLNPELVKKYGVERVLAEYGWWPDAYQLADVRMQKRINAKLKWQESGTITKLFGIEFTEMENYDLENDYPAIFYYYGYVGLGLYLIFLAYFLVLIVRTLLKYFKNAYFFFNFVLAITYILQLGLAQFSGAILRRPNASIYMSLILGMIYYQCNKIDKRYKEEAK